MSKRIASTVVRQRASNYPVGYELNDDLKRLQNMGFRIIDVFETKVNPIYKLSNQGFIILYECEDKK